MADKNVCNHELIVHADLSLIFWMGFYLSLESVVKSDANPIQEMHKKTLQNWDKSSHLSCVFDVVSDVIKAKNRFEWVSSCEGLLMSLISLVQAIWMLWTKGEEGKAWPSGHMSINMPEHFNAHLVSQDFHLFLLNLCCANVSKWGCTRLILSYWWSVIHHGDIIFCCMSPKGLE